MKRLGRITRDTWINGVLVGLLGGMGSFVVGFLALSAFYDSFPWQLLGWGILASAILMIIFIVIIIYVPYKGKGAKHGKD